MPIAHDGGEEVCNSRIRDRGAMGSAPAERLDHHLHGGKSTAIRFAAKRLITLPYLCSTARRVQTYSLRPSCLRSASSAQGCGSQQIRGRRPQHMDQCRDRARPQAARREPSILLIFGDDFGSACTVLWPARRGSSRRKGSQTGSQGGVIITLKEYKPETTFPGRMGRTVEDSESVSPAAFCAKAGAPNVLFIVIDDSGFGQLGCYGGRSIRRT